MSGWKLIVGLIGGVFVLIIGTFVAAWFALPWMAQSLGLVEAPAPPPKPAAPAVPLFAIEVKEVDERPVPRGVFAPAIYDGLDEREELRAQYFQWYAQNSYGVFAIPVVDFIWADLVWRLFPTEGSPHYVEPKALTPEALRLAAERFDAAATVQLTYRKEGDAITVEWRVYTVSGSGEADYSFVMTGDWNAINDQLRDQSPAIMEAFGVPVDDSLRAQILSRKFMGEMSHFVAATDGVFEQLPPEQVDPHWNQWKLSDPHAWLMQRIHTEGKNDGLTDRAEELARSLSATDPFDAGLARYYAWRFENAGQAEQAILFYEAGVYAYPNYEKPLIFSSRLHENLGRREVALATFEKLADRSPNNWFLQSQAGTYAQGIASRAQGGRYINQLTRAERESLNENMKKAEARLNRALEIHPRDPFALYVRGKVKLSNGQNPLPDSMSAFEIAPHLAPRAISTILWYYADGYEGRPETGIRFWEEHKHLMAEGADFAYVLESLRKLLFGNKIALQNKVLAEMVEDDPLKYEEYIRLCVRHAKAIAAHYPSDRVMAFLAATEAPMITYNVYYRFEPEELRGLYEFITSQTQNFLSDVGYTLLSTGTMLQEAGLHAEAIEIFTMVQIIEQDMSQHPIIHSAISHGAIHGPDSGLARLDKLEQSAPKIFFPNLLATARARLLAMGTPEQRAEAISLLEPIAVRDDRIEVLRDLLRIHLTNDDAAAARKALLSNRLYGKSEQPHPALRGIWERVYAGNGLPEEWNPEALVAVEAASL